MRNYWSNQMDKLTILISKRFLASKSGNLISSQDCNPATTTTAPRPHTNKPKCIKPFNGEVGQETCD